jgi:hypothetical protein
MAGTTLFFRFTVLVSFSLALAGVVQVVRYALLKHEHRSGTVAAVHEERVREEEAHERELHERELHERELHDGAH